MNLQPPPEAIVTIRGHGGPSGPRRNRQARQRRRRLAGAHPRGVARRPDARGRLGGARGLHPTPTSSPGFGGQRGTRLMSDSTDELAAGHVGADARHRRRWVEASGAARPRSDVASTSSTPNMRSHLESAIPRSSRRTRRGGSRGGDRAGGAHRSRRVGTDGSAGSSAKMGPADAEHLTGGPRVPLGARMGVGAGDGSGGRPDRSCTWGGRSGPKALDIAPTKSALGRWG